MSELPNATIDASTRFCAVYGHPVNHSASPAMQNAGITTLGLNWRYLAFDVHPNDLRQAIQGAKAMKFIGLNLTVPHKLLALDMVDELDESGHKYGAINTIRWEARSSGGNWQPLGLVDPSKAEELRSVGFNTDADAVVRSLREDLQVEPRDASILVLGAGGAGSVAALRLAEEGARELYLVNRTASKAEELARQIQRRYPGTRTTVGFPSKAVDLLLNGTSAGLKKDDPLPFDAGKWSLANAKTVYDMIYRPAETELLRRAKAAGCRVSNGLGMLLYQGVKALEIWTGRPGPVGEMRRALESAVYGRCL